jgi:hypothetical protein
MISSGGKYVFFGADDEVDPQKMGFFVKLITLYPPLMLLE